MKSEVIKSTKTSSFADVAIEWLSWERCVCKESSYIRYEDAMYRYLLPRLVTSKSNKLPEKMCLIFVNRLLKEKMIITEGGLLQEPWRD